MRRIWGIACASLLLPSLWVALSFANAAQLPSARKEYRNARWGFCVNYPGNWRAEEGTDKGGASIYAPEQNNAVSIAAGALRNQPRWTLTGDLEDERPMTLEDNVQAFLKASNQIGESQAEVVTNRPVSLDGTPAREVTVVYRKSGTAWKSESVVSLKGSGFYVLSLTCPSSTCGRYEDGFQRALPSFSFNCQQPLGLQRR